MKYSWEDTAEQTLKEYQQILGTSPVQSATTAVPVKTIDIGQFDMASGGGSELDKLLEEGEEAARNRNYNLAHEILERAERLDAGSVRALRARGAVYMAENLISQARRYFEGALRLNASDAKSLSGLGMCELHEGQPESAYNFILRALEIEPYQLVAILQLVQCAYMLERFDALESVLVKYLQQSPQDLEMRYCLAGCLYKRGKTSEAQAELTTILARNPKHQGSLQLQQILSEQNTTAAPAQPAPAAAKVATDGPFVEQLRELENAKRDRRFEFVLEKSAEYLKRSDLSKTEMQTVNCLRAEALVFSSQITEADDIFTEVLATDENCVRALCGRGAIASAHGKWAASRQCFEKAIHAAPRNDVALAGLGMIEQADGNAERAWSLYRDSLTVNPENHRALYGIIELGYQFKRFADIEECLKAYLDYHPGDINYLYSLAGCYYAQGRYADASDEVARVLIFDSQNKNARELQKMIDQRSGDAPGNLVIEKAVSQSGSQTN